MGIKTWFRDLGRGIKRGFDSFVSGAGNIIGKGATFLQQKAIPGIASGASAISGLLNKATPLIEGVGGAEAGAIAGEAGQVAGKVGDVVGKFADYIGSNAKAGRVANAQEIAQFAQSPFGMAIRKSQGLPPLDLAGATAIASGNKPMTAPAPAPAPKLAVMGAPTPPKYAMGLAPPLDLSKFMKVKTPASASIPFVKPMLGSNPNTYSPASMNSGIEAPPAVQAPSIIKVSGGSNGTTPLLG